MVEGMLQTFCFSFVLFHTINKEQKNPASLGKTVDRNKQKRNKQVNEALGKRDRKDLCRRKVSIANAYPKSFTECLVMRNTGRCKGELYCTQAHALPTVL